jgi:drug/metabolite transporter (DMT)-like permease
MGFYGNQLVKNISMFLSLKKFTVVMLLIVDLFLAKKKISWITIVCIFMMTVGSLLVGMDTFSNDYWGYILVFISDVVQIVYSKLIEVFRNYSNVSSLKLLIYNCYLSIPILIVGALIADEHNKIYIYLQNEKLGSDGTIYGLGIYLFLSCMCCVILLSSFFISNEKSSSLITNLLTNTKSVLISVIMYFFDKSKNKLSLIILTGLIMSTIGAIFINAESLFNNLSIKKSNNEKDKSKDNNEEEEIEEKETNETELIEVNDDEKSV